MNVARGRVSPGQCGTVIVHINGMQTIRGRIKKATSTRRGRIIGLTILAVLVLAVAGGIIYWKIYRKQIIRNELEGLVNTKSAGLYNLKYDSLLLDEAAGNLSLRGITISYDSLRFAALNTADKPAVLISLTIPAITVLGVQTPRALLSKEIVGKTLTISQPQIQIWYTDAGRDSARYLPPGEIYKQVLGKLNLIRLDTVHIDNATITTHKLSSGKKIAEFKNTSVRLMNLALEEDKQGKQGQILFSENAILTTEEISFPSTERSYRFKMESFALNSIDSTGSIAKFRIIPLLEEDAFVRSLPTQDDRFDFTISDIRLTRLDMPQLFNENIFVDSIILGAANMKIYRDLAIRRDKKNRVGTYPHQLLSKLPVTLRARKLVLSGGFIEYKERSQITRLSGKVQFHDIYAVFDNVTNEKETVQSNNIMTATINSRFLDRAPLKVNWRFYLQNPRGRFDVKGNLGKIEASEVNRLTEPMGPAKLEKGKIRSLNFSFEGHNYGADGSVKMLYEDLRIALLEKEEGKKELDKKTITSLIANIVVKNDNPSRNDPARVINVHFDRDTNRSIFHLVWKSIFKGIKETVGIKK